MEKRFRKNVNRKRAQGQKLATVGLVATLLMGVAVAQRLAAQGQGTSTAPPANAIGYQNLGQQFTLRVQSTEVLVDVRVTDHKGDPVTNLKASDFHLYEDGVLQNIESFQLENVEQLAQERGASSAPQQVNLGALPKTTPPSTYKKLVQNRRLIVLYFDLSSMQIPDLWRALTAAENFVNAQLTPADLVAVVTYSSQLRILQNFTNQRDALLKSIKSIEVGQSATLASNGSTGDAGGSDAFGNTVVTQDTGNSFTPDETEFNIFNTDEKLTAMESLADLLAAIPGRKSVINFSSGIEQTGVENDAQMQATLDAANRADVSLYTVDARGLLALPPGGDASAASPSGTAIYTSGAFSSQMSSLHNSRDTLSTLATDTGGRMFTDLNNFAPVFHYVQKVNSSYYLLGYTPTNQKADGQYRRIRVTLVNSNGLKVEARPGYYAPVSFAHSSKERKELELEQALDSQVPVLDLPMAVETPYFREPDGHYYIVLAAKIPGSVIPFRQHSKAHQTSFDFAWRATDAKGKVAGGLLDTLPVKLDPASYQKVRNGNILYEGGMVLPPGTYQLKVVAREDLTGKMGTFEKPLVLPAVETKGLHLSSVVLSNELSAGALAPKMQGPRGPWFMWGPGQGNEKPPLEVQSDTVLPSVTRVFEKSQNLYVYLQSYDDPGPSDVHGAKAASSGAGTSSMALIFFRNGVQVSEAGPYPALRTQGKVTVYFKQLPLAQFPPGRYWMQVNVMDPATNQVAFAKVPLAILPAAKPPQP